MSGEPCQIPSDNTDIFCLGKGEGQEEEDCCEELGHGILFCLQWGFWSNYLR